MDLPGKIGKYEPQELLGGGMSLVYRALDPVMGRKVAIKILSDAGCRDPEARRRFLAEARMAGNVKHENVVSIYDFGEDENQRPYMVMEFLEGESLRDTIRNGHTGQLGEQLRIALAIARALQHIHSLKMIHRDVKPDNIHISATGVVKLVDFGIAKAQGLDMTQAGFILGTPYYMAPEQVAGHELTPQADIYAFGALLFELITGKRAVNGDNIERIFYSILNDRIDVAPLLQAGAPQAICELTAKCLEKNPAARPDSFGTVIAELKRTLAGMNVDFETGSQSIPVTATHSIPNASSRRRWMVPALALGAILLVVAVYLAVRPKGTRPETARKESGAIEQRASAPPRITTPTGEMLLVPAGEFRFGEGKELQSLPAFYIDRTEVTNASYAEFCSATGHALPQGFPRDKRGLPVVNVSFIDARDFAAWAGKRIPKPAEWEKAARGVDGRAFPWGDTAEPSRANVNSHAIQAADSLPQGASPSGAVHMVGNVWEFVDQLTPPSDAALGRFPKLRPPPTRNEPWYMIRGQSYGEPLMPGVIWDFTMVPARWKDRYIGFRCAKDAV